MKRILITATLTTLLALAACTGKRTADGRGPATDSMATASDLLAAQADGVDAAPAELWSEEVVEAQVRAMYDRLNAMAKAGQLDCSQLDREFCTSYFCGALRRIYEYDSVHAKGDNRFMGDEGYHWLVGLEPPLTIERIKAELLTGDMAQAQVKFKTGQDDDDDEGGFMALELWVENARWRVNNFDQPEAYGPGGYIGLMEEYARAHDFTLEEEPTDGAPT